MHPRNFTSFCFIVRSSREVYDIIRIWLAVCCLLFPKSSLPAAIYIVYLLPHNGIPQSGVRSQDLLPLSSIGLGIFPPSDSACLEAVNTSSTH
jgi:hypothetical protein